MQQRLLICPCYVDSVPERTTLAGFHGVPDNHALTGVGCTGCVVVVVVFTLTDRASTIPSNIRGCQSGTWSQRGTKVNGSHHGDNPLQYSDQQGSKSRQKVMRLYKRWHRPIAKGFIKLPLLHIESSLDRLGLLSPTHDQRSQQQTGQTRSNQF